MWRIRPECTVFEKTIYKTIEPETGLEFDNGVGWRCQNCAHVFRDVYIEDKKLWKHCPFCGKPIILYDYRRDL